MSNIKGITELPDERSKKWVFSTDASPESGVLLIKEITEGLRLWFYDHAYPSPSDPGAFVTFTRTEGSIVSVWRNHGWSSGGILLEDAEASDYLWACRNDNMIGAQNAIGYLGMDLGPIRRKPREEKDPQTVQSFRKYMQDRIASTHYA